MCHAEERSTVGNDKPVVSADQDRYGFTGLAEKLSEAIIRLDRSISTVIGIEGPWGSGKTSLLNLLLKQMEQDRPAGTHVLQFSPWLTPNGDGSVEALLLPVAAILDEEETKRLTGLRKLRARWWKGKASPLALNVLRYSQQASGRLAPLAELAGNFLPGAGMAASVLKTVSAADLSARSQTTAAMRNDIERKIAKLNLSFIVVLDDLDRLEPAQAIEVLRLIRSVADFSGFHYVLCYDPAVLAHAVEQGLQVADGRHYLQKIVPLSFSLPRPESFDLRQDFHERALALYTQISGADPEQGLLYDLKDVAITFGATLSTPREVSQVLSSLAFRFPGLREFVWFPDLCLVQLLRVTLPGLYEWVEYYLTEYAVMASSEGSISDKEKEMMIQRLKTLLTDLPAVSPLSAAALGRWLPGIDGTPETSLYLFSRISEQEGKENDARRRLGSSLYWRCYFAFLPAKDFLPADWFKHMLSLAEATDGGSALAEYMLSQITDKGFSTRTNFERMIDRLNPFMLARTTPDQCRGILGFLLEYGDKITARFLAQGKWQLGGDLGLKALADRLLLRLFNENRAQAVDFLSKSLTDENRFLWSIAYLRYLRWKNGMNGNQPAFEGDRVLSDKELVQLSEEVSAWLQGTGSVFLPGEMTGLSDFIYAWREIAGPDPVTTWLTSVTKNDEDFLRVLLSLRYEGISSAAGFYQALRLSDIAVFFGGESEITARLDSIELKGKLPGLVKEVRTAIGLSRR